MAIKITILTLAAVALAAPATSGPTPAAPPLPLPGANTYRVELTTVTRADGRIVLDDLYAGAESKRAFAAPSVVTSAATNRVQRWSFKRGHTTFTVNGITSLPPAVGDICNVQLSAPPVADKMTCVR